MDKLLAKGAEASIILEEGRILKRRLKKSYRIDEIDFFLRKRRTSSEARLIERAGKLVPCPKILSAKEFEIGMEYVKGPQLKEVLDGMRKQRRMGLFRKLGKYVGELHRNNIIHGDLTTSNLILGKNLYFIDFGLGFMSPKTEDKAVDILLLKRALLSRHPKIADECFKSFLSGYGQREVIERLAAVESRGRYKQRA